MRVAPLCLARTEGEVNRYLIPIPEGYFRRGIGYLSEPIGGDFTCNWNWKKEFTNRVSDTEWKAVSGT